MNRLVQRGVALVITLIMLSVVTFMAIAFLALSRRDRYSVSVSADQQTASLMADAALAHAQSKIIARLMARTNMLSYEFMVSTNFIDPLGFNPNAPPSIPGYPPLANPTNVNYQFVKGTYALLSMDQRNRAIHGLQYDPRPPVYVDTNLVSSGAGVPVAPLDFRFFWDFNRNGLFDTNGWQVDLGPRGQALTTVGGLPLYSYRVGDPEWIGVLQNPNLPHSGSNRFIGRFAYIVLPVGKSLDLNYIYNQAKLNMNGRRVGPTVDGYWRNEGVGPWELNLAAFLRGLNTNEWPVVSYNYQPGNNPNSGWAFNDAFNLLTNRYGGSMNNLSNALTLFGTFGANVLKTDLIDDYTMGPRMYNTVAPTNDLDNPALPWPGSESPRPYADVQDLFNLPTSDRTFVPRIVGTNTPATSLSSYDRYTFYRLLSQMGVDSAPASVAKINLNYATDPQGNVTFTNWTPLGFFTNAANRMLQAETNSLTLLTAILRTNVVSLSLTNIPIYPLNFYTPEVHRVLQLAANIYDATTNRYTLTGYPYLPSVFRPVFAHYRSGASNVVAIAGYVEVTNTLPLGFAFEDAAQLMTLATNTIASNINVWGVPWIIGAKKGLPNFNEYSLQTAVQVSRKLQVSKSPTSLRPNQTNQLYLVGISNSFGLETWNSYRTTYPRRLTMVGRSQINITLTNYGSTLPVARFPVTGGYTNLTFFTNIQASTWLGNQFIVPLNTNMYPPFLDGAAYVPGPPAKFVPFSFVNTNLPFAPANGALPQLGLVVSNRLEFAIIDNTIAPPRIVDFVNLDNLGTQIDISGAMLGNQNFGEPSAVGAFWQTNRLSPTDVPMGVRQQILQSLGQAGNNNSIWVDYSADPVSGQNREKAIDLFRTFVGLQPFWFPRAEMQQELGNSTVRQAPFTPTRKIYQIMSWQANDPLVHYRVEDLVDLTLTNNIQYAVPPSQVPTNSNLGQLNRRWRPWGGNPSVSSDVLNDYNLALKDPMVRTSDDWDFPTNKLPNIGWLGRVHRGTPWQTVYLKSAVAEPLRWRNWSGSYLTHPTNDWQLVGLFTTALTPSAARGFLSVNQTNLAAWSAALGGVSVLSNAFPRGLPPTNVTEMFVQPESLATPQLRQIVNDLNVTRASLPDGTFHYLGQVLATPSLTTNSPYLNLLPAARLNNISDEVYERIPQQILGLLKEDEPWVVVYTYGQSLAPAGPPVLAPGTPYDRMYTNYQVTAEVLTKHFVRIVNTSPFTNIVAPMALRQRFQYLQTE